MDMLTDIDPWKIEELSWNLKDYYRIREVIDAFQQKKKKKNQYYIIRLEVNIYVLISIRYAFFSWFQQIISWNDCTVFCPSHPENFKNYSTSSRYVFYKVHNKGMIS
jgi:hypothetical protein